MLHRFTLSKKARETWHDQTELISMLIALFPIEIAELQSGIVSTTLGVWLLLPFNVFDATKGFTPFRRVGITENEIGVFFFCYGSLRLMALLFDLRWLRLEMALFGVFLWSLLAIIFQSANPHGPAVIFLAPHYLLNLLAYIKARPRKRSR